MRHAIFLAYTINDIYLIFHQCYQRGNNDSRAFHYERRQLVAKALTATRRHQHEGVVAL